MLFSVLYLLSNNFFLKYKSTKSKWSLRKRDNKFGIQSQHKLYFQHDTWGLFLFLHRCWISGRIFDKKKKALAVLRQKKICGILSDNFYLLCHDFSRGGEHNTPSKVRVHGFWSLCFSADILNPTDLIFRNGALCSLMPPHSSCFILRNIFDLAWDLLHHSSL